MIGPEHDAASAGRARGFGRRGARLGEGVRGDVLEREWRGARRGAFDEERAGEVEVLREEASADEIFAVDHPEDAKFICTQCGKPLVEKTFSYMCSGEECEFSVNKDQKGKYLFPETAVRLLADRKVGPLTGFDGTKAPGYVVLQDDGFCEIELERFGIEGQPANR